MDEGKSTEKKKEDWVRAHKLAIVTITLSLLSLVVGITSAAAGWLKFPAVGRAIGLKDWLEDSSPATASNESATEDESKLQDEIISHEYEPPINYGLLPVVVRVTWRENSKTIIEIYNKKKPAHPFQTFSINDAERPITGFGFSYDKAIGFSGDFLIFDDLNFDGYVDFLVRFNHSVCCYGYKGFTYNSYHGAFAPDENLNEIFSFFAGYELIPPKKEIHVFHHCPPGNLKIIYQKKDGILVPVRYYDINIHNGKETEVEYPEEVCG